MAVSTKGRAISVGASEGLFEADKNSGEPENTYILRPIFQQRFRPSVVKDCIHAVLKEELAVAEYLPDEMPHLTKRLSEIIKDKLKELGYDRYKMVVQVVIGEQRGEGVFMAARCFWDADTDNYTHDVFMNAADNEEKWGWVGDKDSLWSSVSPLRLGTQPCFGGCDVYMSLINIPSINRPVLKPPVVIIGAAVGRAEQKLN